MVDGGDEFQVHGTEELGAQLRSKSGCNRLSALQPHLDGAVGATADR